MTTAAASLTIPTTGEAVAVETAATDELRATVRVSGPLSAATMPLLIGVLSAHERAGRRYLRVDLRECRLTGRGLLEPLRARHAALAEAGGMLVFDNADEPSAALLRQGDLFVTPAPVEPR
jgi:hypothetical protein